METIRCPYCECKVRMSDVETDDGTCPECGAPLMGPVLFDQLAEDHDDDDDHSVLGAKGSEDTTLDDNDLDLN